MRRPFSPFREEESPSSDRSNWLLASSIIAILLLLAILGIVIALIVRVNQLHDKVDDIPTSCPSPCNTSSSTNDSMSSELDFLPSSIPQESDLSGSLSSYVCASECPAKCSDSDGQNEIEIFFAEGYDIHKSVCHVYGSDSYWFFLLQTTDPIVAFNDGKVETYEEVCIDAISDKTSFKECLGAEYKTDKGLCVYFFKCSGIMDAKHSEFLEISKNVTKNFDM